MLVGGSALPVLGQRRIAFQRLSRCCAVWKKALNLLNSYLRIQLNPYDSEKTTVWILPLRIEGVDDRIWTWILDCKVQVVRAFVRLHNTLWSVSEPSLTSDWCPIGKCHRKMTHRDNKAHTNATNKGEVQTIRRRINSKGKRESGMRCWNQGEERIKILFLQI